MTNRSERILAALTAAFGPDHLELKDDSARHAGHAGAAPGGETHYILTIRSAAFSGLSRVEMHRRINDALKAEFETGLHALTIKASSP